jgi:Domain of unknown function (DUF1330)/Family of unknown function (DUF6130)
LSGACGVRPGRFRHISTSRPSTHNSWADASDIGTIDIKGLPPGEHKILIQLVNGNHDVFYVYSAQHYISFALKRDIMKKGYWVVAYRSISDESAVKAYGALALPAVEAFGGRFLTKSTSQVQAREVGL